MQAKTPAERVIDVRKERKTHLAKDYTRSSKQRQGQQQKKSRPKQRNNVETTRAPCLRLDVYIKSMKSPRILADVRQLLKEVKVDIDTDLIAAGVNWVKAISLASAYDVSKSRKGNQRQE
ncbi:hypothetical protein DY000_02040715 [Brassica cretica]|uniref:Uncharacterized protein n=1 Tax=Brassica cretica TaxID=69181 RepID=A0ABQ7BBL7_BRACR|nr:hypothetical protein DY000_02040715 [Brassica cretica]